ncbi:MAG TPA: hypothetical protein VGE52_16355 [Pirellulales bacterium]
MRSSDEEREQRKLGGIIHTYQKFDPHEIPSPTAEPADVVSPLLEHMLAYGDMDEISEEDLARAIRIDPSQIPQLGPSLNAIKAMLEELKKKILEKYETDKVRKTARNAFRGAAQNTKPPKNLRDAFHQAVHEEQLHDMERLWYRAERSDDKNFAHDLMKVIGALGDHYQVEELASKYNFTGRESMTVPEALEIKDQLDKIEELLKQIKEAAKTGRLAVIEIDELKQFAEAEQIEKLQDLQKQIEEMVKQMAERQGLEKTRDGFRLTPQAMRTFQGKLLNEIFSDLTAARSGRHEGPIVGEGAVETQKTKQYEFGDSVSNMDTTQTLINAMVRSAGEGAPLRLKSEDIVVHHTRNNPKAATVVLLDMSGSMRYSGLYINVKRMGLALDGLIRKEYPGDFLQFIEMYSFAKPRHVSEVVTLMPKNPTIFDSVVQKKYDMSDERITEGMVHPHFTNIQRGLQLARQFLANQDTPNKQIVLITDGLPTAHFEGEMLYLLYPPHQRTEEATMREAQVCAKDGITMNIFLLPTWSQSREDVQFAYRMAESTKGRVFFCAGKDLDRFVLHDYIHRKKRILG